jgi:hypothetical protein
MVRRFPQVLVWRALGLPSLYCASPLLDYCECCPPLIASGPSSCWPGHYFFFSASRAICAFT